MIELLLTKMTTYNIVPIELLQSVLIPIPKDKSKVITDSKNYCAIVWVAYLEKY